MKTHLLIAFLFLTLNALSQTTVTIAGGYSKSLDFHGAVGYKYKAVGIEAGYIVSPSNTSRPVYATGVLTADVKFNDWSVTGIGGMAYKIFTAEKKYADPWQPMGGIRISYRYYFIGAIQCDRTTFFSLGIRFFTNAKYNE